MNSDPDYYIRLSAYDREIPRLESELSKEYATNDDIGGSGGGDGGGGGGGGGCFLNILK